MTDFFDFLSTALGAPTDKLFIVAGLLFLGVAVVGGVTGYIRPGPIGRIIGGLVGPLLIVVGIGMQLGGGLQREVRQIELRDEESRLSRRAGPTVK